jgi:cytochrome b
VRPLNQPPNMNSISRSDPLHTVRVWDLPTRVFHWALVFCVIGLVVSGLRGGDAMVWHFRMGYAVLSLLLFRIVWGLVGGHWSRFASFIYAPGSVLAYLKGRAKPEHSVGHNPLGAGSVFAMLLVLLAQVGSGLFADDDIANSGPLSKFVANATVALATNYHKNIGKFVLMALVVLHIAAIVFYLVKKKENLVKPMIGGDKHLPVAVQSARDTAGSRVMAAVIFGVCASAVAFMVNRAG